MSFLPDGMPLPAASPYDFDLPFWEACKRHELVIQRCSKCATLRHTPEIICHVCRSFDYDWQRVSGKGKVFSHMNVVYPAHPALRERVPFNVVVVELEDAPGIRMVGNLIDTPYEEIQTGMPVEVFFEDHPDQDVSLPLWRRTAQ